MTKKELDHISPSYAKELDKFSWEVLLEIAVYKFLQGCPTGHQSSDHYAGTPKRVVKAYREAVSGIGADIGAILGTTFPITKSEMIVVKELDFVSMCSHHLMWFSGKAWFGYIPKKKIVGLSKIPRLIQTLSRMPQVQEDLSNAIVEYFQRIVSPSGCGVVLEATHSCMSCRGVRATGTMRTTSLTGTFLSNPSVKQEFLEAIR